MTHELPFKQFKLTWQGLINAVLLGWEITGTKTSRAPVRLAVAQMMIETGGWSPNFCLSGMKTHAGDPLHCWQYFKTTEYYWPAQLADAQAKGPGLVQILQQCSDGRTKVALLPRHPYCCFRAFEGDPNDSSFIPPAAVTDHLLTLQHRFPHGWSGLLTGDPRAFAEGLHSDHYYTATERQYENGIDIRLQQELTAVTDNNLVWGDVPEIAKGFQTE